MKNITPRLICGLLFIVMTIGICIGYAALSDSLSVQGNASIEGGPPVGVYIKHVEVYSRSNVTVSENDYILPTNHTTTATPSRSGASVTYKITVHNNTDLTYWYIGPLLSPTYGTNNLIGVSNGIAVTTKDHPSDTSATFNSEDWIPPQTERDFYVTYTYNASAQTVASTMINFHFDVRIDAVHDEFLAVLNNLIKEDSYETLTDAFDEEYAKNGAVTISSKTHAELFEQLFQTLTVNIDGTEKEATVVIRRENVDGKSTGDAYSGGTPAGCEYTLYITVESLTPGTRPTVYAISYSEGGTAMGEGWYQVGELYEGTAPIKADGTIDYAAWRATHKTYEMADGISYKVAAPNGDQYDIMNTLEQLISAQDQDIFNDIDNKNIFKKVYDIIQKHKNSTDPAVLGLRKAFEDASIFYRNLNNGQEFKVVRGTYTRAEIIYAIKNIQKALDYYYQAYPEA